MRSARLRFPATRLRLTDTIAQGADALHFQFDNIARLQHSPQLGSATRANCPGAEEFSGLDRLSFGGIGNQFFNAPRHGCAGTARPLLAIDPRDHGEAREIQFISRGYPGAEGAGKVLAFRRAKAAAHFGSLNIACTEVIEDRHTEEMGERFLWRQVATGFA